MVNRIKQVMEYAQMSPTAFADKISVNRSSLTHIFSGRNQPSLDIAKKILTAFPEISTEWLIMGMGNMLQEVNPAPAPKAEPVTAPQPLQQIELFADEDIVNEPDTVSTEETAVETPKVETPESEKDASAEVHTPESQVDVVPETPVRRPISTVSRGRGRASESYSPPRESKRDRLSNSQGDKKITKILFFYEDKSFDVYTPNNE